MDIIAELHQAGFDRAIALDGAECGYPEYATILLALWPYEAEEKPDSYGAWIHPYYFASQQAYMAAVALAKAHAAEGVSLRDDIRLKPIFARLPGFSQGRNTLSYAEGLGSRFHVQIFTLTRALPVTCHLEEKDHALHCGECHKCVEACPTNALEGGVFHRDRCLRNWQMSGKPIPECLRSQMGNRLIGCDICQQVCPHNSPAQGKSHSSVKVEKLLSAPKEMAALLRPEIGVNLTITNRVLAQACLIAGCSRQMDLLPMLKKLQEHPSPAVAEHAAWAYDQLKMKQL